MSSSFKNPCRGRERGGGAKGTLQGYWSVRPWGGENCRTIIISISKKGEGGEKKGGVHGLTCASSAKGGRTHPFTIAYRVWNEERDISWASRSSDRRTGGEKDKKGEHCSQVLASCVGKGKGGGGKKVNFWKFLRNLYTGGGMALINCYILKPYPYIRL